MYRVQAGQLAIGVPASGTEAERNNGKELIEDDDPFLGIGQQDHVGCPEEPNAIPGKPHRHELSHVVRTVPDWRGAIDDSERGAWLTSEFSYGDARCHDESHGSDDEGTFAQDDEPAGMARCIALYSGSTVR